VGNRSKYLAITAAVGAGVVAARRRARIRQAFESAAATFAVTESLGLSDEENALDEAHAPGHRHLPTLDSARAGRSELQRRPWTRHARKIWEPYWPR
jgi:hypothetical protein